MSIENEIKEALMRHAEDVEPRTESWGEVEGKVRSVHQRRIATTVFLVALIAAAGVMVPRLLPSGARDGLVNPATTGGTDGVATFRNELQGYQVTIPDDWHVGGFEGSVEFNPPGLPGLTVGEDTFAVESFLFYDEAYDDTSEMFGDVSFEPATLAGLNAVRSEDGVRRIVYRLDWSGRSCPTQTSCPGPQTLQFIVVGSTDDLWSRYAEMGRDIVGSLTPTGDADFPTGDVYTPRGFVPAGIVYDELTASLIRFMEARIEGAPTQVEPPAGIVVAYEVLERNEVDANSVQFEVRVEGDGTRTETVGVGPDGVRFANES
ncbi:MAG TPA: hypothetical protein VGB83_05865 [Actinomycetota bacterium]